jgi:TPR repeat protein
MIPGPGEKILPDHYFDDFTQQQTFFSVYAEQQYQRGLNFYYGYHGEVINHLFAFQCFEKAHQMGHVIATAYVGLFYYHGIEIKQNISKGNDLIQQVLPRLERLADEHGYSEAYRLLDYLYQNEIIPSFVDQLKNYAYKEVIQNEDAIVQFKLACLYKKHAISNGLTQNQHVEMINLYKKSAERGYAPAMHGLGKMYEVNKISIQNKLSQTVCHTKAKYWYEKAVDQQYVPAMHSLAKLYESGEIEEEITKTNWKNSLTVAQELYEQAAVNWYLPAFLSLAQMCDKGLIYRHLTGSAHFDKLTDVLVKSKWTYFLREIVVQNSSD